MQIFLMVLGFVMSIAWLNIIANEVVSVLQALGLLAGISTGESTLLSTLLWGNKVGGGGASLASRTYFRGLICIEACGKA